MEKPRVAPLMVPHPMYIELQKKSPMGMMRDYNITVIEEGKSISVKQFYKKFVSKSLPAIFQGHAKTWKIMDKEKKKNILHDHEGFNDGMSFTTEDHRSEWDQYLSNLL